MKKALFVAIGVFSVLILVVVGLSSGFIPGLRVTKLHSVSPDGKYVAYIRYSGMLCSVNGNLYVRPRTGRAIKGASRRGQ